MEGTPLSRVQVDSEVGELKAVVVHVPGLAHSHILPEHIEAQVALKDLALNGLGASDDELASVDLVDSAGQKVRLNGDDGMQLVVTTKDGKSVNVPLGDALSKLFVENPQYTLFDDIVDADAIADEHRELERVLQTAAPHTLRLSEMLFDALHQLRKDDRLADEFFLRLEAASRPAERANIRESRDYLDQNGERRFLNLLLSGRDHSGHYVLNPLPNLLFTRDLANVVGNTLIMTAAPKPARRRESVLSWLVFTQHPLLADLAREHQLRLVDMLAARAAHANPDRVSIEGGDILNLGNGALLVGVGERTTHEGVIEMARLLWADDDQPAHRGVHRIIVVEILDSRASMHLDTIFTLAHQHGDTIEAMVFGPYMHDGGYGELTAWQITPDDVKDGKRPALADLECWRHQKLDDLLRQVAGLFMTPMFCGQRTFPMKDHGRWSDPAGVFSGKVPHALNAKREQWTDGANLFALAPGIVLTYARNYASLDEMARRGYRVVPSEEFRRNSRYLIQRAVDGRPDSRIVVTIGGSELCRGRGGPRCLTLPLLRESLRHA